MAQLRIRDVGADVLYSVPEMRLEQVAFPIAISERELVGPGGFRLAQEDPVTERLTGNVMWTLRGSPRAPARSPGRDTRQFKSLLTGWLHNETVVQLEGPDVLELVDEPLRRMTDPSYTDKRFCSAHPWWGSSMTVYVDGVSQDPADYTIDADMGYVTFDAAQAGSAVVTVTGNRAPHVQVTPPFDPNPLNGYATMRYAPLVTLREVTPT